jgi:hypothetical protein
MLKVCRIPEVVEDPAFNFQPSSTFRFGGSGQSAFASQNNTAGGVRSLGHVAQRRIRLATKNDRPDMTTNISNPDDLKCVAATLHDARFTPDAIINFNAEAHTRTHTWSLQCWVLESKQGDIKSSRQWQACVLSFAGVSNCRVNIKEIVPYYELATLRFTEHSRTIQLVTHYGIEICLEVEKLAGTLLRRLKRGRNGVNRDSTPSPLERKRLRRFLNRR